MNSPRINSWGGALWLPPTDLSVGWRKSCGNGRPTHPHIHTQTHTHSCGLLGNLAAVEEANQAIGAFGHVFIVGDHDDGAAFLVELEQDVQDFVAHVAV